MRSSLRRIGGCIANALAPRPTRSNAAGHNIPTAWLQVWRCTVWLVLSVGGSLATGSLGWAQADADRALQGFPKTSWYDPQTQQWLPPTVDPVQDEPLRRTGRVSDSPAVVPSTSSGGDSWWNWDLSWWDFSWLGPWLRVLVFALLALLLAAAVATLTYFALRNYLPRRYERSLSAVGLAIDPARIVDLPFDVTAVDGDPLAQAERHLQSGDFDAASVLLYGYLLLVLDQSRLIHLQKGKTNRMYLREVQGSPRVQQILQQSMLLFESCYFGKHAVSRQQFLTVWNTLDEFHRLLHAPQSPRGETAPSAEYVL